MSPLLGPLSEIDTILEKLEDDEDVQKVFTNLV
jgi:transcriptional/translational regulatory protein YebC/TACO1